MKRFFVSVLALCICFGAASCEISTETSEHESNFSVFQDESDEVSSEIDIDVSEEISDASTEISEAVSEGDTEVSEESTEVSEESAEVSEESAEISEAIPELTTERAWDLCCMAWYPFHTQYVNAELDQIIVLNDGVVIYHSFKGVKTREDVIRACSADFTENGIDIIDLSYGVPVSEYDEEYVWTDENGNPCTPNPDSVYFVDSAGLGIPGLEENTFEMKKISDTVYKAWCMGEYDYSVCIRIVYQDGAFKFDGFDSYND